MASASLSCKRRKDMCSEPPVMACGPRSLNDLPDEILLKILSHLGPEDLCRVIAKVSERWNVLAKDIVLWKSLSYKCDWSFNISRIKKVRCTALLGFRTNCIMNFAPSSVLKVQNPKEHLRSCISFHPE